MTRRTVRDENWWEYGTDAYTREIERQYEADLNAAYAWDCALDELTFTTLQPHGLFAEFAA